MVTRRTPASRRATAAAAGLDPAALPASCCCCCAGCHCPPPGQALQLGPAEELATPAAAVPATRELDARSASTPDEGASSLVGWPRI